MNAIRTVARNSQAAWELRPLRVNEREVCELAERILDEDCTVYADCDGDIVAVALSEDACARLERDPDAQQLPSLDYAFDICRDLSEDLDFERGEKILRADIERLRAELTEVAGKLDRIRKGEQS